MEPDDTKMEIDADQYTCAWICALDCELAAAKIMLDYLHDPPQLSNEKDRNRYIFGEIGNYNIVIVNLPYGEIGKVSALTTVMDMKSNFKNLTLSLFVGIGGGCPRSPSNSNATDDLHLGDVVIGVPPWPGAPAVVQYDRNTKYDNTEELASHLDKTARALRGTLTHALSFEEEPDKLKAHLRRVTSTLKNYKHPGLDEDVLFQADYKHRSNPHPAVPCQEAGCDMSHLVQRLHRSSELPAVHTSTILSGDGVIQSAQERDLLSERYYGALCVETEAAGLMDEIQPLIIRGISDYADSHKNPRWRRYAASTAAAFAREIFLNLRKPPRTQSGSVFKPSAFHQAHIEAHQRHVMAFKRTFLDKYMKLYDIILEELKELIEDSSTANSGRAREVRNSALAQIQGLESQLKGLDMNMNAR